MSFKPTSKIFDKSARRQAFSNDVMKSARVFRTATVRRMTESSPSGKIDSYEDLPNRRGQGFMRGFRRSARGQRPAVETTTLINAVQAVRTGEFSAKVDIADKRNPRNGASANEYAETLQTKLDRKIMTAEDKRLAEIEFKYRSEQTLKSLL